jgi:phosphoglycerate dehydrogenase-like enzyme
MNHSTTLLVIADPKAEYLSVLDQVSGAVRIIVSDRAEVLQEACVTADAILYSATPDLLRSVLPRATRLRWLHSLKTGVESILFPELVGSPVIVSNSRGVHKGPLAEFVMAGVLFFTKDIGRLIRNQQLGVWKQFDSEEARGKVMGIVGYGQTGRACAEVARAHGMRVLGLRRRPELSRADPLLEKVFAAEGLLEMLASCDYVVLSAPATQETCHLIGESEIDSMKSSAVLINVGRGSLINEGVLIRALKHDRIRGAALDVFEVEPLPSGHPFYGMNNVLLSPHSTDHTPGWRDRAMQGFVQNLERFIENRPIDNIVDKLAGY